MAFKETFHAKKDIINLASFCFVMVQEEKKRKKTPKVPACLFKSRACLADMPTFSPQHTKKEKKSVFICKLPGLLAQIYEKKPTTSPYIFT